MAHTIEVPDSIWEWAQRKSGRQNPASFLRELLHDARLADSQNGKEQTTSEKVDNSIQWRATGIDTRFDGVLAEVLQKFIASFEDEEEALNWWKNKVSRSTPDNPPGLLIHLVENM